MSTTLFREYMIRVVANIPGKWDADGTPTQWMFDETDATVIVDRLIDAFVVALTGADLPDDDVLRGAPATPAPFERYMARYGDAWGAYQGTEPDYWDDVKDDAHTWRVQITPIERVR